jgi:hypothetical protein
MSRSKGARLDDDPDVSSEGETRGGKRYRARPRRARFLEHRDESDGTRSLRPPFGTAPPIACQTPFLNAQLGLPPLATVRDGDVPGPFAFVARGAGVHELTWREGPV